MGFSVEQKTMADLLGMASKIAENRKIIPILDCARITFGAEGVMVEATNLENWISGSTPDFVASEKANCTAIVPCKQFHSIVSSIPKDQKIDFNITEQKLMVKTATAKYNFGRLPDAEWPTLKDNKKAEPVVVKAGDFSKVIAYVVPAVAVNDVRYMLCGVNLKAAKKKGLMRLACTNGHCASLATIIANGTIKTKEGGIIIPRESIVVVGDLISKVSADVDLTLFITENRYTLEFSGDYTVSMTGKLIDGQFPDVDRVVPYDRKHHTVTIPRQESIDAMQRIATMGDKEREKGTPSVKMAFSATQVKLSATATVGDAEETFPSELLSGKGESVIFAATGVILPLLNALEGKDVVIMADPENKTGAPIILCERDAKIEPDSAGFFIFMPVRG